MKKNPYLISFVWILLAVLPAYPQRAVQYKVSFPNAAHHEAEIEVTFNDLPMEVLEVAMARSSPGRYALHEFAKNVYRVVATDGQGKALKIYRPDPYRWDISGHTGKVVLHYTLFADLIDGTYAAVDERQAHLNIPATFMYSDQVKYRPVEVTFDLKDHPEWKIATQLKKTGEHQYYAPDLYYFMDSPVQLGDYEERHWTSTSNGKEYQFNMVLHHDGSREEVDQYAAMAQQVVEEEKAVFGELPDYDFGSYTFLIDYLPYAEGDGMEHRNSTSITGNRPLSTQAKRSVSTVSHEFFHCWNVERIRPASLEPFDFQRTNMSGELWFAEGFTQYYTNLILCRAGIITPEEYINSLSGTLNYVLLSPSNKLFSPVEMSYQAPFVDAAVSIDPDNKGNTFISYYSYGNVLGLALDLSLRTQYEDLTLDGFMREIWKRFGRPELPYTVRDLQTVLGEYTHDSAFAHSFFDQHIMGTTLPDVASLLSKAGVKLGKAHPGVGSLGRTLLDPMDSGLVVTSTVYMGSPLYEADIEQGDRILSINGEPVHTPGALKNMLATMKPGARVEVRYMQREEEKTSTLILREDEELKVEMVADAPRKVKKLREAWLNSQIK